MRNLLKGTKKVTVLQVHLQDSSQHEYTASSWTIDSNGHLTVITANGEQTVFAPGQWVRLTASAPREVKA